MNYAPSSKAPKWRLGEAEDELKKAELLDERDQMREREADNAVGEPQLEAVALMRLRGVIA